MSDKENDKKSSPADTNNVVDLFTRREVKDAEANKIVRIAPELDGLEMLYSNDANKDKMFSMKILCWALRQNGDIDAMVPWLTRLVPARNLNDPLNGHWEGYFDSRHEHLFYDPPVHKVVELEGANAYFKEDKEAVPKTKAEKEKSAKQVMQEIPDSIGTHAVLSSNAFQSITLSQITSWRLTSDGSIQAMIADKEKIGKTPVLPGDTCLYSAQDDNSFKYFFHHVIANKIKSGDPDAIEAFSKLIDN